LNIDDIEHNNHNKITAILIDILLSRLWIPIKKKSELYKYVECLKNLYNEYKEGNNTNKVIAKCSLDNDTPLDNEQVNKLVKYFINKKNTINTVSLFYKILGCN